MRGIVARHVSLLRCLVQAAHRLQCLHGVNHSLMNGRKENYSRGQGTSRGSRHLRTEHAGEHPIAMFEIS